MAAKSTGGCWLSRTEASRALSLLGLSSQMRTPRKVWLDGAEAHGVGRQGVVGTGVGQPATDRSLLSVPRGLPCVAVAQVGALVTQEGGCSPGQGSWS